MRIVTCLILALCSVTRIYATEPVKPVDSVRPSVANTQTFEFLGKNFELKFKDTAKPVRLYEYYLANESPDLWMEMVDFQVFPQSSSSKTPKEFAEEMAASFMKKYPKMQYALHTNDNTGEVILDYMYPESTRKEEGISFYEFSAYKLYRDAGTDQVVCVHYARNIEAPSRSRKLKNAEKDLEKARHEALPALADMPLFRQ